MKKFLFTYNGGPEEPPYIVQAPSIEDAYRIFGAQVFAKDSMFREEVRDTAVNLSFAERFFLATDQEQERFNSTGTFGTEPELVESRIKRYFEDRPDLGLAYSRYLETEDETLITEELFAFIGSKSDTNEHGYTAVPLDEVVVITDGG